MHKYLKLTSTETKSLLFKYIAFQYFCIVLLSGILVSSCKKDPVNNDTEENGKLSVKFSFYCEGNPMIVNEPIYVNEAGNQYLISEVQYFISDLQLHDLTGKAHKLNKWKDNHYVDSDLPNTHTWDVFDPIPAGNYSSVSFTFGFDEMKNQSFMFVNPPESYMFWPEFLGGGYHYLKLNGKWFAPDERLLPFDFHLGIGQIYAGDVIVVDSITSFVHNHFKLSLPLSNFTIEKDKTTDIVIRMNIENWFNTPHIYDHNQWGGDIMQKQAAMLLGKENGHNVFVISN